MISKNEVRISKTKELETKVSTTCVYINMPVHIQDVKDVKKKIVFMYTDDTLNSMYFCCDMNLYSEYKSS